MTKETGRTIEYHLIRSKRRTLGLEVRADGILVRAPMRVPKTEIDDFILKNVEWIEKQQKKLAARKIAEDAEEKLTMEEIRELAERAKEVIPARVRHFAELLGVTYGRITIRNQRSKWGSCSAQGNLNFNCLLMLAPPEVLDGVIVHELCHRKHMDHSKEFYEEVLRVYPDYKKWDRWLKERGHVLMSRMRR